MRDSGTPINDAVGDCDDDSLTAVRKDIGDPDESAMK
jgi:hypothetical protein